MKPKLLAVASCAFIITSTAHAHRVWVETDHTHGGEILVAELGYGHFPELEPIAKDRLNIFKPLQLVTEKGKETLLQKGEYNYQYRSQKPVKEGSYLVIAEYKPTFWSKNAKGWKRVNKTEMPDASYCEESRMYGKNIVNVGHESADTAIITKPVGHNLEIVPLDNPANVQVGERFKVRVLHRGEPLANQAVTATFKGFDNSDYSVSHKVEAQAFYDVTNEKGEVDIIPLRQGFWKINVEYKTDFRDQSVCLKESNYSTMTFEIGHVHHH